MTDSNANCGKYYYSNVPTHSHSAARTMPSNNNEDNSNSEDPHNHPSPKPISAVKRSLEQRGSSTDSLGSHQQDSARTSSSSGNSAWSPRKQSGHDGHSHKNSAKRKLSESRGVNLPDIKIVDPSFFASSLSHNGNHPESDHLGHNPGDTHCGSLSTQSSVSLPPVHNQSSSSQLSPPMTSSPVGHVLRHPLSGTRSPAGNSGTMLGRTVLNICIFLPDHKGIQFSVEGGRIATTGALLKLMWNHLSLPPVLAEEAFALWMVSPLLEIQLKPHHVPFQVRKYWSDLLRKFTTATPEEMALDEPLLVFRRNVLLSKRKQRLLCENCEKAAEVLFLDAREAVVQGRYLTDLRDALHLAAIDIALTLGPFHPEQHTPAFIREVMYEFLPEHHVSSPKNWSLFSWAFKVRKEKEQLLVENYRQVSSKSQEQLRQMYLDTCMSFPFYGAAFFTGQIERPPPSALVREKANNVRRLLKGEPDSVVRVAISRDFFTVMDAGKHTVLLAEPCLDCSWRKICPPDPENESCLPSFFLHFPDPECEDPQPDGNNPTVGYTAKNEEVAVQANGSVSQGKSKLLQIFSKQAVMMEALMNSCVECSWSESESTPDIEDIPDIDAVDYGNPWTTRTPRTTDETGITDNQDDLKDTAALASETPASPVLSNKLDRLCLATFDGEGNCIQAVGSLQRVLKE